ncbi:MAG: sugar phosphate isomerase/epimerase [candidate division WOR-3 bacterium]|nr:sugar phosphate isomerase/epimerase [candidate division WOR-3 bacterium]
MTNGIINQTTKIVETIKNRLGIQILFDFNNILSACDFALEHKIKVLELNLNNIDFSHQIQSAKNRRAIAEYLRKYKLTLLFHAAEGLSFFIPDRTTQNFIVKSIVKLLHQAQEIGVKRVTFHLGTDMSFGVSAQKLRTFEVYPDFYNQHLYIALSTLKKNIPPKVFLCVENVGGFRYPFILSMLPQLLGGRFGLTMDIGHINRFFGIEKEQELKFFWDNHKHIKNCHIHDNNGEWDQHNIIGEGNINFQPYFELLANSDTYFIFEVRPKESALECIKRFDHIIAPTLNKNSVNFPAINQSR